MIYKPSRAETSLFFSYKRQRKEKEKDMSEDKIIHEFQKNAGELVRISFCTFKGKSSSTCACITRPKTVGGPDQRA